MSPEKPKHQSDSTGVSPGDLDRFYMVLGGHIFFQTLSAAVELDLFTLLDDTPGISQSQIIDKLGLEQKPLRILLLGCTAVGLIKKEGDGYANTPVATQFLSRHSENNLRAVVRWQNHINYRPMFHFLEAIKANANVGLKVFDGDEPFLYGRLTHHPELEKIFQDAMEDISIQSNEMLAEHVDFSRYRHLVDVGGGNATNIIQIAGKNPGLKASVFDSPSVCKIARENIRGAGLETRLDAVEGDCFKDPFPDTADCILFCHFFTIWSAENNLALLRKAYDALPEGGSAIVFQMMQDDTEDGPLTAAMGAPYFLTLATGEGMMYSWREYEGWMREAGFSKVERQVLVKDHGAIIGVK